MFRGWTLNRIGNCSWIWISMSILVSYHRTCLNVNAVLWTYSRIRDRTTLTTLEFWIRHAFIVILVRVLLNLLQINWIPVWLSSCRCGTLHYQIGLMLIIMRSIWRNSTNLHSHGWIMLVKNLLSYYDLICWNSYATIFLVSNLLLLSSIICRMERMNWSTTLCWKLRSNLRRPKAIILTWLLLLSKILFDL